MLTGRFAWSLPVGLAVLLCASCAGEKKKAAVGGLGGVPTGTDASAGDAGATTGIWPAGTSGLIFGEGCRRLSDGVSLVTLPASSNARRVDAVAARSQPFVRVAYESDSAGVTALPSGLLTRTEAVGGDLGPLAVDGGPMSLFSMAQVDNQVLLVTAAIASGQARLYGRVGAIDSTGGITFGAATLLASSSGSMSEVGVASLGAGAGYAVGWLALPGAGGGTQLKYMQVTIADGVAKPGTISSPVLSAAPVTLAVARGLGTGSALAVTLTPNAMKDAKVQVLPISAQGVLGSNPLDVYEGPLAAGPVAALRVWDGSTLVAWGRTVQGTRREVRLVRVDDDGAKQIEHSATQGFEEGSNPAFAVSDFYILLGYYGGPPGARGIRAQLVSPFGESLSLPEQIAVGSVSDPGRLAIATGQAGSLAAFVWSELTGTAVTMRSVALECRE